MYGSYTSTVGQYGTYPLGFTPIRDDSAFTDTHGEADLGMP